MKVSCIIPVGPDNTQFLQEALDSLEGCPFDEVVMCVAAPAEFHPAVQGFIDLEHVEPHRGPVRKLVVSYEAGTGPQKNLAVAACSGDWIVTLDSDDLMVAEGQQKLFHHVQKVADPWDFDVIYGNTQEFSDTGVLVDRWPGHGDVRNIGALNCVPNNAWFRKTLWHELKGFKHCRYEDWEFWVRAHHNRSQFNWSDVLTYRHRRWPGSVGGRTGWRSDLGYEL